MRLARTKVSVMRAATALLVVGLLGCIIPPEGGSPHIARRDGDKTPVEPPVPAPGGGTFQLVWQDDFNKLDRTRWRLMSHSFPSNLAIFSSANTRVVDGVLYLDLKPAPDDKNKPYRGVEMRSIETMKYGKVEARARFAAGGGVVSSLVMLYTPWPADDWNELDFEFLGAFHDRIQTNAMIYSGPPVSKPVQHAVSPTGAEQMVNVAFDPSAEFHTYAIEWTPTTVRYLIDGAVTRTWNQEIAKMKLQQNILLTIWASSAEGWAGAVDSATAPTSAAFDWVRAYLWQPAGAP
jgi:endo-1,3-1,4-beta-glycanase ExoK